MRPNVIFSPDRKYRYTLTRKLGDQPDDRLCAYVLLNPSTADEVRSDPTVTRCLRRAERNNFAWATILNIFAWRSTDPNALYEQTDPVGPENDDYIVEECRKADQVICGWGGHGELLDRGKHVLKLLRKAGVRPFALKVNGDGHPSHPLYLSYELEAFRLRSKN